jgi:hypothetical protein
VLIWVAEFTGIKAFKKILNVKYIKTLIKPVALYGSESWTPIKIYEEN